MGLSLMIYVILVSGFYAEQKCGGDKGKKNYELTIICSYRSIKELSHARELIMLLFSILEGGLQHESKASGHTMAWTKAVIQKPAPHWEGTAAYKGEMKEIKLEDYRK